MLAVSEIRFNHAESSATNDGFQLRRDGSKKTNIVAPEWTPSKSDPAAYALARLKGKVTIKTKLTGGPVNGARRIRAVDYFWKPPVVELSPDWRGVFTRTVLPEAVLAEEVESVTHVLEPSTPNVLGRVEEREVRFDGNGDTVLESFELEDHQLQPKTGVGRYFTKWKWQVLENGNWSDFAVTEHTVYLTIDLPKGPWNALASGDHFYIPWISALEAACRFARGAVDEQEAAALVTEGINRHPLLSYQGTTVFIAPGATAPTIQDLQKIVANAPFMLSSFLRQLAGTKPFKVNCLDCTNAVVSLASILGCWLTEGPFNFHGQTTSPILGIGGDPSRHADWKQWSWGWHAAAWSTTVRSDGELYDPTLQLDVDPKKSDRIHSPWLPLRTQFKFPGTTGQKAYSDYLSPGPYSFAGGWWDFRRHSGSRKIV